MISKALGLWIACAAALVTSSAAAHQQKSSISIIQLQPQSQTIEISHRFNIHDVEHALRQFGNTQPDVIGDARAQQEFSSYVEQHFLIRYDKDRPIQLDLVGFEIEGNTFWVYQEAPINSEVRQLDVANKALQEIWPKQTNLVNFEGFGELRSLRFVKQDQWQTIMIKVP